MNTKKSSPNPSLPESMEVPFLKPLEPISFQKFRPFSELVRLVDQQETQVAKKGLFETLIGSTAPIYQDSLESPERYDPEALTLLSDLMTGRQELGSLSQDKKRILDEATLSFAESARALPKEIVRPAQQTPPAARYETSPAPVPGVDVPATELPAFWWLR